MTFSEARTKMLEAAEEVNALRETASVAFGRNDAVNIMKAWQMAKMRLEKACKDYVEST